MFIVVVVVFHARALSLSHATHEQFIYHLVRLHRFASAHVHG